MSKKYIQLSTAFVLSKAFSPSEMMALCKYAALINLQNGEPTDAAMKRTFRSYKMRSFVLENFPLVEHCFK